MQSPDRAGDEADFFDGLRPWSRIKLRILEKYLRAYLNKRGGSNSRIFYLDGFAGQGYYGEEGPDAEGGSPLRIARLAQQIKNEGKSYRLICLNTELGKKRCADLRKTLAQFDSELVQVFCGAFTDHLPRIREVMGSAPAVCFLDPFGVVGISVNDIRPLLVRPDTEILLTFSTPTLHRLAGFAKSDAKDARGKFSQVSRVLGEDPQEEFPEWLVMLGQLNSDEWEAWTVNRYLEQMKSESTHLRYAMGYPVREKLGGGVKYYLVFASRKLDAFPLMNDFICTEEDDLHFQAELASRHPGQMSMFEPRHVTEREARLDTLIDEIHAYGIEHQGINRKRLIEEFSLRYLGEFKQKHYRQMLDKLVKDGRAEFGMGEKNLAPITFR